MSSRTDQHPARDRSPLDLPPGYEAIALREVGDAFVHAREIAAERGAGTLVWVRRFDRIEFAVVLEPDEALAGARRVLYAVLNATADALGAYAPPEKPVAFEWPATLRLDGGILGGAQLAWPEGTPEDAVPAWLVAGVTLRALVPLARALGPPAKAGALPGHHPLDERLIEGTSLASEGFELLEGEAVIESFARHLMVHVDTWQAQGFTGIAQDYLARLQPRALRRGIVHGIDGNGDLLTRPLANVSAIERQDLRAALSAPPRWLDPDTQEPWL